MRPRPIHRHLTPFVIRQPRLALDWTLVAWSATSSWEPGKLRVAPAVVPRRLGRAREHRSESWRGRARV